MRAIVKTNDGAELREVPAPLPKPGEVVIAVELAGLCRTDSSAARGLLPVEVGTILGHEFTGKIVSTGKSVRGFAVGARVGVMPIIPNQDGYYVGKMLGVDLNGAYAEFVAVPSSLVFKLPDSISDKQAAYLEPMAASLAVLKAPIKRHQRGIVLGDDRIATLTHRVLVADGFKDVKVVKSKAVTRLPDNSLDFAVETVATSDNMTELIRVVKPGGVIVLKSRQTVPLTVSVASIVKKDLTLSAVYYGSLKQAVKWLSTGKIKVDDILGRSYSLEEAVGILLGQIEVKANRKIFFQPKYVRNSRNR